MKILIFIICISAAIAGCKKGNLEPSGQSGLVGTWELRHYSGTIAGVSKDFSAGNGMLIQLNADSTFKRFTDFKQDNQGSFKVVKSGVDWGGVKYDAIYFNGNGDPNFVVLKADSLTIGNTYPDGITSLYVRQKK
jgi:hypothetical protein